MVAVFRRCSMSRGTGAISPLKKSATVPTGNTTSLSRKPRLTAPPVLAVSIVTATHTTNGMQRVSTDRGYTTVFQVVVSEKPVAILLVPLALRSMTPYPVQ